MREGQNVPSSIEILDIWNSVRILGPSYITPPDFKMAMCRVAVVILNINLHSW